MKPFQKITAVVLALVLIASAAGCVPISLTKQWSYKYSDDTLEEELDIGVYIYALYQAYSSAQTYAEESDDYVENEPFTDLEITDDDGNTAVAKDWIKDEAEKIAVSLISIDYLVEEYGATWDEANMESAEQTSQDTWDLGPYASYGYYQPMSEELEPYGISYDSFEKSSYVASIKQSAIFDALYGEGGAEEVTDDELEEYFVKKYVDYSYIPVQMYTSETNDDGDTISVAFGKKKINKIVSELEEYADQLSSGSTTFKKVLKACKKDYDVTSDDAVQDSVELYSDAKSSNSNVAKAVKSLDSGSAKVVTVGKNGDSPMAYLVVKNDINDDVEEYVEGDQRSTILQEMKSDDFTDFLEQSTQDIIDSDALTANTSVLDRYDPSMFFVREDETDSDDDSDSDSDE